MDAAFRIQERCVNAARRTLVGNWVHSFPDDAYPGPNLDWLHELVRFFDRYLNGVDNGWDEEPALVWFERRWAAPEPFPAGGRGDGAPPARPVAGVRPRELVVGRDAATGAGPPPRDRRPARPTAEWFDRLRTARPSGRRGRCPGAPDGIPTASRGTCGRTSCAA